MSRRRLGRGVVVVVGLGTAACSIFASYDGLAERQGGGDGGPDAGSVGPDGSALPLRDGGDGGCDPSAGPAGNPCVLRQTPGVYVATRGVDSAAGTPDAPVATLRRAVEIARATSHRVYVCGGLYAERVELGAADQGLEIYGGLACATSTTPTIAWSYTGVRAVVSPATPGPALIVRGVPRAIVVEDLDFHALPAVGLEPTGAGSSSVGVLVVDAPRGVTIRRADISAGAGARGRDGATDANYTAPNAASGNAAPNDTMGGAAQACTCRLAGSSAGGRGGDATPTAGESGAASPLPASMTPPRDGKGGATALLGARVCEDGNPGAHGTPPSALAPGASGFGTLTIDGWSPQGGSDASPGGPAQGGGGGGGGRIASIVGAGSGGACGGCGGAGGGGGKGGGASIALVSVASSLRLEGCALATAAAGGGGNGAGGQQGQLGGDGAPARAGGTLAVTCAGGMGGHGAGGGGGGGGAGGVSLGVGYLGPAPVIDGASVSDAATLPKVRVGEAGARGGGGAAAGAVGGAANDGPPGAPGRDGIAQAVRAL